MHMLVYYMGFVFQMEENPFESFKISSSDFLNSLENRTICPKCLKSRKFYCYNCFVPVKGTENLIPKVKVRTFLIKDFYYDDWKCIFNLYTSNRVGFLILNGNCCLCWSLGKWNYPFIYQLKIYIITLQLPLKVDIIKHPNECDGKSTSAHAAVLAPDDVRVFTYPCIPDYPDPSKVGNSSTITYSHELQNLVSDTGMWFEIHRPDSSPIPTPIKSVFVTCCLQTIVYWKDRNPGKLLSSVFCLGPVSHVFSPTFGQVWLIPREPWNVSFVIRYFKMNTVMIGNKCASSQHCTIQQ